MNQLLTPVERKERIKEERNLILKFLRYETYTHIEIVKILINVSSVQAAHQTLNKMIRDKLIKKAQIDVSYGRSISLFGITNNGLAHAFDLDEKFENRPTFQPSKVKSTMLQHKVQVQMFIVKSIEYGYSNVINADLLNLRKSECKVPDLTANMKGRVIAVEIELTIKSRKRYADIVVSHLLSIKNGQWDEVHYIVPTNDFKSRLERVFKSIKSVPYKNKKIELTDQHLCKFKFFTY